MTTTLQLADREESALRAVHPCEIIARLARPRCDHTLTRPEGSVGEPCAHCHPLTTRCVKRSPFRAQSTTGEGSTGITEPSTRGSAVNDSELQVTAPAPRGPRD